MAKKRFTLRAAIHLILIKDNKILLLRRFNTGWQDGKYSLIAGHLDGKETVAEAMKREAKEEANITIEIQDLHVVHTMHIMNDNMEYIDFFFSVDKWKGKIKNMEPNKCDELQWYPLEHFPQNTLSYIQQALDCYRNNIPFSEFHN